jgi:hypothetical protein
LDERKIDFLENWLVIALVKCLHARIWMLLMSKMERLESTIKGICHLGQKENARLKVEAILEYM